MSCARVRAWMDFVDVLEIAVFHFVFCGKMMAFESLSWRSPTWWSYHITDFGSSDVFFWRPFSLFFPRFCGDFSICKRLALPSVCAFLISPLQSLRYFFSDKEVKHIYPQNSCQTPTWIRMEHRCLWPSFFCLQGRTSFLCSLSLAYFSLLLEWPSKRVPWLSLQSKRATLTLDSLHPASHRLLSKMGLFFTFFVCFSCHFFSDGFRCLRMMIKTGCQNSETQWMEFP